MNSAPLAKLCRIQWVGYINYNKGFHSGLIIILFRQCVKIISVLRGGLMEDTVTGTALSTSKPTAEKLVGCVSLMVSICLHLSF